MSHKGGVGLESIGTDVKAELTVFLLAVIARYSSRVQQPERVEAILGSRHLPSRLDVSAIHLDAPTVRDEEASPCQPHARTRRKPGALSCSQTPSKPAPSRKAASRHCTQNELLSSRSQVRVLPGAPTVPLNWDYADLLYWRPGCSGQASRCYRHSFPA